MPLPGGAADKFGNRYEGRWTVNCMAMVMAEEVDSIRLEPPGIEGEGVEFWLKRKGRIEYHQVKRQQTARGHWELRDLRHVLASFYPKLVEPSAWCVFVSTQSAGELQELSERSRSAGSFEEFQAEFLKAKDKRDAFHRLRQFWGRAPEADAYARVRRVEARTLDETTLRETVLARLLPIVDGDAETVLDVLAQLALDSAHRELTAYDIWHHLEERGIRRREWGKDPHVLARVGEATQRYLAELRDRAILGRLIPMPEAQPALDMLGTGPARKSVLLSGEAGVGKSSVILQVVGDLVNSGIPVLPLRVDRLEARMLPAKVGEDLGLPESPPVVLAGVAKGRDCVLVIDQLDAVSLASGRNPQFFDCVHLMVRQAEKYPNMRVLMACRTFDLEYDNRLRRLAEPKGTAREIQVKRLPEETVRSVVAELGADTKQLSPGQVRLLSLPLHLALLAEIAPRSGPLPYFSTAKALLDLFWDRKQDLLRERLRRPVQHRAEAVDALCRHMSENQVLSAPEALLDRYRDDALAMVSEHVLTREPGRYAFFHETFFDYAFARRFVAGEQSLLDLLVSGEQHLFRRAQARQILLHERDGNWPRYLSDLHAVLTDPRVRFHVKQVVFALLAQLTDPSAQEWEALGPLLHTEEGQPADLATNPLARGVWGVIDRSAPWFAVVDSLGLPERWLQSEHEGTVNAAIWLLHGVADRCPDRVADLLQRCATNTDAWHRRAQTIFSFGKLVASRKLFDLSLDFLDKGWLDEAEFWMMVYELPKTNPAWGCEAIGHYLNRRLAVARSLGQKNPFDNDHPAIDGSGAPDVLMKCAEAEPRQFVTSVLPFAIDLLNTIVERSEDGPWRDPVWGWRAYGGDHLRLQGVILEALATSLRLLAENAPASFSEVSARLKELRFETTQFLLMRSYAANGPAFANEAADYLREEPQRLHTGYSCSGHGTFGLGAWVTRELIQAISPHCSEERLRRLEQTVLSYYPRWERKPENWRYRGETQFVLLDAIAEERRSPGVTRRLTDLARKFRSREIQPPRPIEVTCVGSPIPQEAVTKMNDDQWLSAIGRYSRDDSSEWRDDRPIGGAHQLSGVLENQAKSDPRRFAELACKFLDDAHPYYFDAVLRGIQDAGLDVDLVMRLCRRCHALPARPCGRSICRPLAKLADGPLPNEALDLVAWYATECPDPEQELWRTEASPGVKYQTYTT